MPAVIDTRREPEVVASLIAGKSSKEITAAVHGGVRGLKGQCRYGGRDLELLW